MCHDYGAEASHCESLHIASAAGFQIFSSSGFQAMQILNLAALCFCNPEILAW